MSKQGGKMEIFSIEMIESREEFQKSNKQAGSNKGEQAGKQLNLVL